MQAATAPWHWGFPEKASLNLPQLARKWRLREMLTLIIRIQKLLAPKNLGRLVVSHLQSPPLFFFAPKETTATDPAISHSAWSAWSGSRSEPLHCITFHYKILHSQNLAPAWFLQGSVLRSELWWFHKPNLQNWIVCSLRWACENFSVLPIIMFLFHRENL